MAFVRHDAEDEHFRTYFDLSEFYYAICLAVRIGVRMTLVDLELPEWDRIQKRDRLIGVSLTGLVDAIDALGWDKEQVEDMLRNASEYANDVARDYAYELRIPIPLLCCTIKPSGTISQLPTVSSGAHRGFAPYYIRRVRITSTDPLAKVMLDLGFKVYPETGQGPTVKDFDSLSNSDRYAALEKANTWVIEFPIKTAAIKKAWDETALEQYERYLMLQNSWTNHNTSITISVGDEEWLELTDKIYETWDDYIGVSFIPKDTSVYPLLPYEAISQEEYENRFISAPNIYELLTTYERSNLATDLDDSDCENGVCAVR